MSSPPQKPLLFTAAAFIFFPASTGAGVITADLFTGAYRLLRLNSPALRSPGRLQQYTAFFCAGRQGFGGLLAERRDFGVLERNRRQNRLRANLRARFNLGGKEHAYYLMPHLFLQLIKEGKTFALVGD